MTTIHDECPVPTASKPCPLLGSTAALSVAAMLKMGYGVEDIRVRRNIPEAWSRAYIAEWRRQGVLLRRMAL